MVEGQHTFITESDSTPWRIRGSTLVTRSSNEFIVPYGEMAFWRMVVTGELSLLYINFVQ